jgi:hypothetical protein
MRVNPRYLLVAVVLLIALLVIIFNSSVIDQGSSGKTSQSDESQTANSETKDWITLFINAVAVAAAVGGIIKLYYEFKRDRDLTEADFIVKLNMTHIDNETLANIYGRLEQSKVDEQKENPFSQDDKIEMANYLSFFEPFYELLKRNVVQIETIDILAYRFFLATNNRFMQEMLICKAGKEEAWRNLYLLHKKWSEYRKRRGLPIWQEEHDLLKNDASKKVIKAKTT